MICIFLSFEYYSASTIRLFVLFNVIVGRDKLQYVLLKTGYYFIMAKIRVHKRNSTFVDLADLVEELGKIGLDQALNKYYNKPLENEAKSIVAGPSFMHYLNKLFRIQIAAGDILQFESGHQDKYFMFSPSGTWDEIIKLQ